MKHVLLAIFVLFAAQPLQVSGCDVFDGQDTGHSQHGNMNDGRMDHSDGQDMDCCDHESNEPDDGCNPLSHCGACVTGLAAVNPSVFNMSFSSNPQQLSPATDGIQSRSCSPPFRPPIA